MNVAKETTNMTKTLEDLNSRRIGRLGSSSCFDSRLPRTIAKMVSGYAIPLRLHAVLEQQREGNETDGDGILLELPSHGDIR